MFRKLFEIMPIPFSGAPPAMWETSELATGSSCSFSVADGSTLSINWDPETEEILYEAHVVSETFLATGYGTSMSDTDMCWWSSNG